MKKTILLIIILIAAESAFSQQASSLPAFTNQDYLQKSKRQKTLALIFLGGGATSVLTGIIIPKGDVIHESFWGKDYEHDGIKSALAFTGVLSMIGSIPLFIASGKNKKKALSVSFKNEIAPQIQNNCFVSKTVPSLFIKFALK